MSLVKLGDGIYVNPRHVVGVRANSQGLTSVILSDGSIIPVHEPTDDVARKLGYQEGPF